MVGYEPTKSPKEIQVPGLNLSRAEAKERADHLYVNSYVVTLDVTKGCSPLTFSGQSAP